MAMFCKTLHLRMLFLLLIAAFQVVYCSLPVFQKQLNENDICKEKICKFTLTLRDDLSMTRKVRPGRIWKDGETFLLELENGKLVQKLGTFYQQPIYRDLENMEVNVTDDAITADGVRRTLIVVNDVFPGPTLEVMEGREVEVIVNNQMLHSSATIHWHGFHMHNTPWMDGVGFITQCPIAPMTSFMYRFKAYPSGTLWYHAHLGGLRADGAFGLFIVHEKVPEIPYYPLIVNHWIHMPFNEYMVTNPYKKKDEGAISGSADLTYSFEHLDMKKPSAGKTIDGVRLSSMVFTSALINGRGQYNNNDAPIAWFTVEPNTWHGFYIINPGVEYTFALSIDHHELEITGLGVGEVEPVNVDTVYLNPGERVRVRIQTKRPRANYWIRLRTLDNLGQAFAVLHYNGADKLEPTSMPRNCSYKQPCVIYNCPFYNMPDPSIFCLASFNFKGKQRARELTKKVQDVDLEVFMDFAFPIGASINGYRFVFPKNHLYAENPFDKTCSRRECRHKGCYCTHYVDLPYNKTVQIVLANYGDKSPYHGHHHTIHLHGYDFVVMKTGFPESDPNTGKMLAKNKDLYCVDKLCRKMRWVNYEEVAKTFKIDNPPIQDTVLLPYGGYTVVRIRTDNPGHWLMHCHQMMHAIEGMDVVVRVAPEKVPPPPKDFPTKCGGFIFSHEDFEKYVKDEI